MKRNLLALILFIASFLVLLHQYVNWGTWFTLTDIHHETFALSLAFGGFLVLYLNKLTKEETKK